MGVERDVTSLLFVKGSHTEFVVFIIVFYHRINLSPEGVSEDPTAAKYAEAAKAAAAPRVLRGRRHRARIGRQPERPQRPQAGRGHYDPRRGGTAGGPCRSAAEPGGGPAAIRHGVLQGQRRHRTRPQRETEQLAHLW